MCRETLRTSDNTAANKVLEALGGPQAVTAFLRKVGDTTTRLDRNEPELNEGKPGDDRDTTTPAAMAATLKTLLLDNVLEPAYRAQLKDWLIADEVGGPLLRAGVPASWIVADRTGAGGFGTRGIIAVMWPPKREPVVAAIYLTGTKASMDDRNRAIADIGRAIGETIAN
jgi:beta-lactamase class A